MPAIVRPRPTPGGGTGPTGPGHTGGSTTTPPTGGTGGGTTTPPPGGGGGAGGGGGGGSSSSSSTSSSTSSIPTSPPPKGPTRPAWYHGVTKPVNLAATIRDGWLGLLGSLEGYPFNANIFGMAWMNVELESGDPQQAAIPAEDFPVQLTVAVTPATGSDSGTATGQVVLQQPSSQVGVSGALDLRMSYLVKLTYALNGGVQTYSATFGPFTGQQLADASSSVGLVLVVNDFPTMIQLGVSVKNADGTPAVGYAVQVDVELQAQGTTPLGNVQSEITDANGLASFDYGQDLNRTASYTVAVLVTRSGKTYAVDEQTVLGQALIDGSFTDRLTLPPPGQSVDHGRVVLQTIDAGTYELVVSRDGSVLVDRTGKEAPGLSVIPTPELVGIQGTEKLTFAVTSRYLGRSATGTATATADSFQADGVQLDVSIPRRAPPHPGRT